MDRNSALHQFARMFEDDPEDIIDIIIQVRSFAVQISGKAQPLTNSEIHEILPFRPSIPLFHPAVTFISHLCHFFKHFCRTMCPSIMTSNRIGRLSSCLLSSEVET